MEYSEYASMLEACSKSDTFDLFLRNHYQNCSILINKSYYFFIQASDRVLILIPGDVKSENREIKVKNPSKGAFKIYQDYLKLKKLYKSSDFIGVGYSNGANLILALSDIVKLTQTICFNPIGPGKKTLDTSFYASHQITPDEPAIQIYRIISNPLSKSFSWTSDLIKDLPGNPELNSHNLKNFSKNINVKVEGISKEFTSIKGITFSPKSGFLLLEIENDLNNYFIEAELATIFFIVYSNPGQFSFTLVPADKFNTSGPYQSKVYYPAELEGTIIGHHLWEADWKLKQMDLGMWYDDLTGQMIPITLEISWFKSGFDFYLEESKGRSVARLWFVMEKIEFDYANSHEGICIRPKNVAIKVQARKLAYNAEKEHGLEDTEGYHPSFKFAEFVNQHIDEFAEIIPEIKKLKEISILISLAQFFRDDLKIPAEMLNLPGLKEKILKIPDLYEKNKVPRLSRKSERVSGNEVNILNLYGGVSMITQETAKRFEPSLINYIKRTDKVLSPFYWNHYDYMNNLFDYQETADEEETAMFTAFSLCCQNECSDPQCNNLVIINCQKLESNLEVDIEELSPYTYEGKIYCNQHHPFRCSRTKCQQLICPGESYAELESGKFHASCVVCEHCLKAITHAYVYSNGFWHDSCVGKEPAMGQDERISEDLLTGQEKAADDFLMQVNMEEKKGHSEVNEQNFDNVEEKNKVNDKKTISEESKKKIGHNSSTKGKKDETVRAACDSTLKEEQKKGESKLTGSSNNQAKGQVNKPAAKETIQPLSKKTEKPKTTNTTSSKPTEKTKTKIGSSSKK